jgi:hypothetical protein
LCHFTCSPAQTCLAFNSFHYFYILTVGAKFSPRWSTSSLSSSAVRYASNVHESVSFTATRSYHTGSFQKKTDMTPSSAIVVGTGVGSPRPTRSCGHASAFGESAVHAPAHSALTLAVVLPDPRRQPPSLSPKPQPRTNLSALKSLRPATAGPRSPSLPQASNSISRRSASERSDL